MAVFKVNNSNGRFTLRLTVTEKAQSTENNYTTVKYVLELIANTAYNFSNYAVGYSVSLDGSVVKSQDRSAGVQYSIADNGTLTLCSDTKNIYHKDDGSKTLPVAFSINMAAESYTPGPLSGSGSMPLTTIPRATQPSIASRITMGSSCTISLPRAASAFSHKLYYTFGSITKRAITNSAGANSWGTTCSWTPNIATLAPQIPKAQSGSGTLVCETYNGSKLVGTKTAPFTAVIPDNTATRPAATMTLASAPDLGSWVKTPYVQGKSRVSATIEATPKYGSSMARYTLGVDDVQTSANSSATEIPLESDLLKTAKSVRVVGYAKDTRGLCTEIVADPITVTPYGKPWIVKYLRTGKFICDRCNENGVLEDNGEHLRVAFSAKWYSLLQKENTAAVYVHCVSNDGQYSKSVQLQATSNGGNAADNYISWYSIDTVVSGITLDESKTYTVTIECVDLFKESGFIVFPIAVKDVALNLGEGGNKAAFGEYAEEDDTLAVAENWIFKPKGLVQGREIGLGLHERIPQNADLDEYLRFGKYSIANNDDAKTILNIPEKVAGNFEVSSAVGTGITSGNWVYIAQKFEPYTQECVYKRLIATHGTEGEFVPEEWKKYNSYPIKDYVYSHYNAEIPKTDARAWSLWYIIKWNSGLVELHARVKFNNVNVSGAWDSMYTGFITDSNIPYPVTFKDVPTCIVTPEYNATGNYWLATNDVVGSSAATPKYQAVRPNSITLNPTLNYYVRGYI